MYQKIFPNPLLKDVITNYWIGETADTVKDGFVHNDIARSSAQILLHYEGDFSETSTDGNTKKSPKLGVYGQTLQNKNYISSDKKSGIVGIKLSTFAIPLLFAIPAIELTNETVDIADIIGKKGRELTDMLFEAKTPQARIDIVSSFFTKQLQQVSHKYTSTQKVIQFIHHTNEPTTLDDLTKMSCLSQRQFQRHFKDLTGFSPQLYLKLIRFEKAIRNFSNVKCNLTELAHLSGYYDQAHFNHDFKLFAGRTPSEYFAAEYASQF